MVSWNSASYVHDFNPSGAETERFLDNWVNTVAVNALALVYLGPHDAATKVHKETLQYRQWRFPAQYQLWEWQRESVNIILYFVNKFITRVKFIKSKCSQVPYSSVWVLQVLFWDNKVNTIVAVAVAPCVAKASAAWFWLCMIIKEWWHLF